jgi:hypothetical protein
MGSIWEKLSFPRKEEKEGGKEKKGSERGREEKMYLSSGDTHI